MAYDKKKILEQAKDAAIKNNLYFIEDIVAFLPITKPTFYDYYPLGSNELNDIKQILESNKIKTKSEIRKKLFDGRGAELLALYKLIATEDERRALSQSYQDHTSKGETINKPDIIKISYSDINDSDEN